ncbi:MAG: MOP flippase family protein, partial [Cyanobacteria bacterium P01_A01_bin.114]
MSLQQQAIKGVLWSSLQNWGRQALFFITFLVLARYLGPETFGLVSLATVFIHLIQALLGQGFADAIIQRKELDPEHLDTAFWCNLGIGIVLFILGLTTAQTIAASFKEPDLQPIIQWMSCLVILSSLNTTQQAILRRRLDFKALAARQLLGQTVGSIVAITMAIAGYGVWSIVAQQIVASLVGTALLWKISNWRPGFRVSKRHFHDLFAFGINVVGLNILTFLNVRGDDLLIGYFLGSRALGFYSVAYKLLVTLTQLLTDTVRQVVLPTFAKLQDDPARMRQAFYKATELVGFAALPAFCGMAILAPELVIGLFGEQWQQSIPVMQLLAFVGLLRTVFNFAGAVIMAMGKPSWAFLLMLSETITQLIAFAIAVQWGIVAVAIALLVASYLFAPVRLWVVYKLIKLNPLTYFKRFLPPAVGCIAMTAGIFLCKHLLSGTLNAEMLLAVCIPVGGFIYLGSIFIVAPKFIQDLIKMATQMRSKTE